MKIAPNQDGIPVVTSTAMRDTLYPSPATNRRVHNLETGAIELYNGTAWVVILGYPILSGEVGVTDTLYHYGDVRRYGGVANTDATTALENAITSGLATGYGVRVRENYSFGSTLTVPNLVSFLQDPGTTLTYTGAGIGIVLDTWWSQTHAVIDIVRAVQEWKTTDTTSVGVVVRNCNWASSIYIRRALQFETGAQFRGDGAGTTACRFKLGEIRANKRQIAFQIMNGGWVNQNTFFGGDTRLDSSDTNAGVPYPGTRYVDMSQGGDGNTFFGTNFEDASPEKNVVVASAYNMFVGCRWESVRKVEFLATAFQNLIVQGYAAPGRFDGVVFVDDNGGNQIIGGFGATFTGSGTRATASQPALTLRGFTSGTTEVIDFRDNTGAQTASFKANATLDGYHAGAANPNSSWDFRNGFWYFGDGVSVPTLFMAPASLTDMDVFKTIRLRNGGGRLYYEGYVIPANTVTPDASQSNVLITANTVATSITNFLNGKTYQRLILVAGDAFTTIKNNGTIKTRSGADVVLAAGQIIELVRNAGVWTQPL